VNSRTLLALYQIKQMLIVGNAGRIISKD